MATRKTRPGATSHDGVSRRLTPVDFAQRRLGEGDETIETDSRDQVRAACVAMAAQASRYLDIVSRELDPALLDQVEFLGAVQRMLLGSPRARLRVLAQQLDRPVTYGHRLIELARRMPTYAEIRLQGSEYGRYNNAFLVADRVGVVYRDAAHRYEGSVSFNDRHRADTLLREFEQMWLNARSHPDLRRVHL